MKQKQAGNLAGGAGSEERDVRALGGQDGRHEDGQASSRSEGEGAERRSGGTGPRFMRGAALMGGAMLVSKALGTLQKIPMQNIAGDRVFGIYNAVYPLYQLLLVMVTAGFPVAISLLVAEREAAGDRNGSARVLSASVRLLAACGIAGFLLLWTGARQIADWLGDDAAVQAVRASSLAFWVAPVMAAFRGYYQGRGHMLPSAASQLAEQAVRVAGMLALLIAGWQLGWPDARLAAGATAGSAIGGTAGLAAIVGYWAWEKKRAAAGTGADALNERPADRGNERPPKRARGQGRSRDGLGEAASPGTNVRILGARPSAEPGLPGEAASWADARERRRSEAAAAGGGRAGGDSDAAAASLPALMKRLALLAVPVTLGALALPVLNVVDAFTVPRLLQGDGLAQPEAMSLFGLYSRGQPLVQLVVMVAGAMGGAFVPALAGARASGDADRIRRQTALVLRAAWSVGAAAAVGLALLAEPMNVMLYADADGSRTFALVGCTALAGTVSALAAAVLQGLGAARTPALLMLTAAALKAAFNAA
ncbi:polysaccharide biosynthesis protein, partial [Paenibacillus sp. MWE-103]|nr:polysaccharide biosynthesis protein [Paenibacillus artemisiicola]